MVEQSKKERIREMREQANAERRRREAAAKRKRALTIVAIIVATLLVVGAIVWAVLYAQQRAEEEAMRDVVFPEVTSQQQTSLDTAEVPITVSDRGAITLGKPDAKMKIDMYLDYSCPFCKQYEQAMGGIINQLVIDGDTSITYDLYHVIPVGTYNIHAMNASYAVAQYLPEKWAAVHYALFANQPEENETALTWSETQMLDLLSSMGVDDPRVTKAVTEGTYNKLYDYATKSAQKDKGVRGTPTMLINGEVTKNDKGESSPLSAIAIVDRAIELGANVNDELRHRVDEVKKGNPDPGSTVPATDGAVSTEEPSGAESTATPTP